MVWPGWMDALLDHLMPLCGIEKPNWPNSCNINYYHDGWQGLGWHCDDEPLFQGEYQDCLIVSLSLGQARTFSYCPDNAWVESESGNVWSSNEDDQEAFVLL